MTDATPEQIVEFMMGYRTMYRDKVRDLTAEVERWRSLWDDQMREKNVLKIENERLQAVGTRLYDERDKLRAEIERLKTDMAGDQQRLFHYEAAASRRDEADRMRAKLIDERECGYLALIEKHATEVKRLKAEMDRAWTEHLIEREELKAEVKRLTLLDQIGKRQIELLEKKSAQP